MKKVYIIGVDHRIQWIPNNSGPEWTKKIEDFINFIHEKCQSYKIDLIAEEFSEYLVSLNQAKDSTARFAADRIGISFLFCDPDQDERQELGIQNCADREREWLRRIKESGKMQVLFVCGEKHIDSFKALLLEAGYSVDVVGRRFGDKWQMMN